MFQIRKGVFETNSSSTHSIVIIPGVKGFFDTLPVINGKINLTGGQFGWDWLSYNDALTKANYAAVFASGNQTLTNLLVKVIKNHTGAKEVVFNLEESYIDHQSNRFSNGSATEAFNSEDSLKNWIFNSESWLYLGNDNEETPPNFYDTDFGIEYNYELSVQGTNIKEKFEDYPDSDTLEDALRRIIFRHPLCMGDGSEHYELITYNVYTDEGKKIDSLSEIDNNLVYLYRIKATYTPKGQDFKGYKVVKSIPLSFKIEKI